MAMTDAEIDLLVAQIDEMAQRIGCRFVPDGDKLLAFRCRQSEERAMRAWYEQQRRKLAEA